MTETMTAAGRKLLNEFGPENHDVRADILAIEQEARALDVVQIREAFRNTLDVTTLRRLLPYTDLIAAEYDRLGKR